MGPEGVPAEENASAHERLFDEYLALALAGSAPDPERFLRERGAQDEILGPRLRALHRTSLLRRSEPSGDLPFTTLGEFRLLAPIGHGGMGLVFMAEQPSLERKVALKILRPELAASPLAGERLKREARTIARLRHPNIVGVIEFGEERGVRYLAMEYVEGRTLEEELRGAKVSLTRKLRWIRDLARALDYAHREGVIHRDVKPSNVRITPDDRALLLDFGLGRSLGGDTATLTDSFAGSPSYCSPEQIQDSSKVDARADVYSLGIVLYRALTGSIPFEAESVEEIFHRILTLDPTPPRRIDPSIPRDLEVVTLKAMERELQRRYQSAGELADELDAVLELRPIRARAPGPFERLRRSIRIHRVASASIATSCIALIAFGAYSLLAANESATQRRAEATRTVAQARERVARYRDSRSHHADMLRQVEDLRYQMEHRWLDDEEYRRLDQHEEEVDALGQAWETTFYEVLDLLRQAERLDPDVIGAETVRGELYRERVRESEAALRPTEADFYRTLVQQHDPDGTLSAELRSECRLEVISDPPGADVFAFRYVEQSKLREGGDVREVAVPWNDAETPILPGAWCLRLLEPAGGLTQGDLIVELAGFAIEGSVLLVSARGEHAVLGRLESIDGEIVRDAWDIEAQLRAPESAAGITPSHSFAYLRADGERCELRGASPEELGIELLRPEQLATRVDRPPLPCRVFHQDALAESLLPPGVLVRTTTSPLAISEKSRLGRTPIEGAPVPRGEYMLLLRLEGYEDLRFTGAFGSGDLRLVERLLPWGTTPRGYVRLPKLGAGDDTWIQEREVTSAEYLEYLNDPATRDEIDGSVTALRYPRYGRPERAEPYWRRASSGEWELPEDWREDFPVVGLAWDDARAYAAWRTEKARAAGMDGVVFALPTRVEFEYGGLGALHRQYTWGRRFRPKWSRTCYARPRAGIGAVLQFPIDESVLGAYDFCGNAGEWLDEWYDQDHGLRFLGGGAWGQPFAETLKVTGGNGVPSGTATGETGMRLVMRRKAQGAR